MSFTKRDRKVRASNGKHVLCDTLSGAGVDFAAIIASALNRDFGEESGRQKRIAQITGVHLRTVKNWLEANNGPSAESLVVLMRHSDEVMRTVLELSQRLDLHNDMLEMKSREELYRAVIQFTQYIPKEYK